MNSVKITHFTFYFRGMGILNFDLTGMFAAFPKLHTPVFGFYENPGINIDNLAATIGHPTMTKFDLRVTDLEDNR